MLPVSNDTLLRVVRRHDTPETAAPRVVGIDDWAWKRGHRYGTIVCDLERRRIIDLLPDREAATVAAWLARHPSITVIARDRGAGYKQAATEGRPEAVQVADRWHLMENASAAFLDAVRRSMGGIRKAMGGGPVDPASLTATLRKQHTGWLRREQENAAIQGLAKTGMTIKDIVRKTGRSRGLVRKILPGARGDIFRTRMNSLEPFMTRLDTAWTDGQRNGTALWRLMRLEGFNGGLRVITEWMTRKRKEGTGSGFASPHTVPSARSIARMMTSEAARASDAAAPTLAIIDKAVPDLGIARGLLDRFHRLIRNRDAADLDGWINDASTGLMTSFATGIVQDVAAVRAALTEPWSNGQTEGQNTKLKMVKRQMYGRAKLDLLRARLMGP
jgi:transposase